MQLTSQDFKRFICLRMVKCQWKGPWEAEVGMDVRCARLQALVYSLGNSVQM